MLPEWTVLCGFILGATIGSFLNVVIYRLPRGISLANPPNSFCPNCKHRLEFYPDMVPLVSWVLSRGKCRYCGNPVPVRYFLVEALNGALWAGLWWQFMVVGDDGLRLGFYALAASALVAVIYIDWELYIIPDQLNAALLIIGLAYGALSHSLAASVWGAFLGWGLIWGIALLGRLLFGKDAMGHGDIKMMRGVGAILGPALTCASVAMAVVFGLVVGLAMIVVAKRATSSPAAAEAGEDANAYEPEAIPDLLILGVYYLLCLDVLAIAFPGVERAVLRILKQKPAPENVEDDNWQPSLTTIPFGPYLAAGAIACMLFGGPISRAMETYWQNATGAPPVASSGNRVEPPLRV